MSQTSIETARPRPVEVPKLSKRGLLVVSLVLMGTPLALIATVWFTLPPVREQPLKADVSVENAINTKWYQSLSREEQQAYKVELESKKNYPVVVVKNTDEVEWAAIGVIVNGNFEFFVAESLPPGEQLELYLHRFQTRQGDIYQPLEWPVQKVKIYARIETGERAYYSTELDEYGKPVQ